MKMIKALWNQIKRLCALMGIHIRLIHPEDNNYLWMVQHDIKTIIDIGANTGQFAAWVHKILPQASIYSFEPLSDCYSQLVENIKSVPNFRALNYAIGEEDSERQINRSEFTPSSSLLPMGDIHKEIFPHTSNSTTETIVVKRLDTFFQDSDLADNILIKIDTQGYEDKVISGGSETISRAKVLIVESSFEELYQGQALFGEIYEMLIKLGFEYKGVLDKQRKSPIDGRVLQADSIFIKKDRKHI